MPSVNFGTAGNIGGQTVLSGVASGIDSKKLIDELAANRKIPITQIEDKIKINEKTISAFNEMQEYLEVFQDSLNILRNIPSIDKSDNIFGARKINLTTNASQEASVYLEASSVNGTDIANYNITINSLAYAKIELSQAFTSDSLSVTEAAGGTTAGQFSEGTFQLNGIDITINEGDSLTEIKAAINAVSSQTNVVATIVKVSATDYRLMLQSTLPGLANAYNITDPDGVVAQVTFSSVQSASDASFTFNSIPMTRSTNTISDIVPGLTLTLKQPTDVGKNVTVSITNDVEQVKQAILQFVGAYNNFMIFAAKQQETDNNYKYKDTAILKNDSTLRTILFTLVMELNAQVKGTSNPPYTVGELGLSLTNFDGDKDTPPTNNILMVDENTLNNYLTTNFEDVRRLFEFECRSTSKTVLCTERSNEFTIYNFTFDIDTSQPEGNQVKVTYFDGVSNVSIYADYTGDATSGVIKGPAGSVIEGLSFIYAGSGLNSVDISISQGIADRLYNYLEGVLKDDGDIDLATTTITQFNTRYTDEITRKNQELDRYIEYLKDKFSQTELAISQSNSTLMFLDAQRKALEK